MSRDNHANIFNFVDVFGKGARGRIQQGTAADRTFRIYVISPFLQGRKPICFQPGISGAPIEGLQADLSTCSKALSIDLSARE
jgi:hypothetical protein